LWQVPVWAKPASAGSSTQTSLGRQPAGSLQIFAQQLSVAQSVLREVSHHSSEVQLQPSTHMQRLVMGLHDLPKPEQEVEVHSQAPLAGLHGSPALQTTPSHLQTCALQVPDAKLQVLQEPQEVAVHTQTATPPLFTHFGVVPVQLLVPHGSGTSAQCPLALQTWPAGQEPWVPKAPVHLHAPSRMSQLSPARQTTPTHSGETPHWPSALQAPAAQVPQEIPQASVPHCLVPHPHVAQAPATHF
jgi:hypothetical protein